MRAAAVLSVRPVMRHGRTGARWRGGVRCAVGVRVVAVGPPGVGRAGEGFDDDGVADDEHAVAEDVQIEWDQCDGAVDDGEPEPDLRDHAGLTALLPGAGAQGGVLEAPRGK